jgi:hypothetical protein
MEHKETSTAASSLTLITRVSVHSLVLAGLSPINIIETELWYRDAALSVLFQQDSKESSDKSF